jgi:hypothetical protein
LGASIVTSGGTLDPELVDRWSGDNIYSFEANVVRIRCGRLSQKKQLWRRACWRNTKLMRTTSRNGIVVGIAVLGLGGCTTVGTNIEDELKISRAENQTLKTELATLSGGLSERDARLKNAQARLASTGGGETDLLPPDAQPGECYARVWVPAAYKDVSEQVLVSEASERVEVVPARYETVSERVLVSEASSRFESVSAVYGTESETVKVRDEALVWRLDRGSNAAPASTALLAAARAGGAHLDDASVGMCFHEHYRPAQFETVNQEVLVREASEKMAVADAQYRMVEKRELVREASSRLQEIPAKYDWVENKAVGKPAHTVWKKGTGPIQRIDEATGEIMCLVEVPATYKTIKKRVLTVPASMSTVAIPAEYKTVKVRELVSAASESKTTLRAQYRNVAVTRKTADATHVWHEVHDRTEPATTRTGAKICLDQTAARYETIKKTVVTQPATT